MVDIFPKKSLFPCTENGKEWRRKGRVVPVREAGKQGFRSWSEIVQDLWKIVQDLCEKVQDL